MRREDGPRLVSRKKWQHNSRIFVGKESDLLQSFPQALVICYNSYSTWPFCRWFTMIYIPMIYLWFTMIYPWVYHGFIMIYLQKTVIFPNFFRDLFGHKSSPFNTARQVWLRALQVMNLRSLLVTRHPRYPMPSRSGKWPSRNSGFTH